jgi:hypothetical protein
VQCRFKIVEGGQLSTETWSVQGFPELCGFTSFLKAAGPFKLKRRRILRSAVVFTSNKEDFLLQLIHFFGHKVHVMYS